MIRERRGIEVVAFFSSSTHFIHLLSSLLIIVSLSALFCICTGKFHLAKLSLAKANIYIHIYSCTCECECIRSSKQFHTYY